MEENKCEVFKLKEYKGYTGEYYFSNEDGYYFGKLTGTTDLVTFCFFLKINAKKQFKKAVDDYLSLKKEVSN